MPDVIPPSGRVHWIGTGMSTGSGLGLVADTAETLLWGRTSEKAESCLTRLGLIGRAQPRAFGPDELAATLETGDILVSMLPAAHHPDLLAIAQHQDAHFACSSYLSPQVAALAESSPAGLVILTDAGLDPGIDHVLAHRLVGQARAALGERPATARFTSYCGSNPAVPNDFRYRFSWAPRGVLTALLTEARYIEAGAEKVARHPWEAVRRQVIGDEQYEAYPNRNSLPFIGAYGFPERWRLDTFVRGTLRLDGWSDAWAPVFTELQKNDEQGLTALAEELALRYPTSATDHDRVVMSVTLEVRADDGTEWSAEHVLDVTGDARENATPRLVSTALAGGISEILAGALTPGLHQAADDPESVQRWLRFLAEHDVSCRSAEGELLQ